MITLPADFRLYVNVARNRKTRRLMREMGDRAFYCIVSLWCYTAENCPDGRLNDMDAVDVADASNWQGDASVWLNYLVDNRWLDRTTDGLMVHDWEQMQPWAARDRSKQSEVNRQNALKRWGKIPNNANSHAIAMQSQCEDKMQLQCPHTHTHTHTQPIPENKQEGADAVTGRALFDADPEPAAINRAITFDPATFTLHGITEADRNQWRGYAPGVDVDAEIEAFLDYMQTHPEALNRTLETGAWKAALNTRFRNAAKYGAPKAATRKNTGAFASFPTSIECEPQRECTEAERLAARKAGEEAYERSRQHRAFHQVGDV